MGSQALLALSVTWNGGGEAAASELAAGLTACRLPATWILAEQAPSPPKFLAPADCDLGLLGPGGLLATERARSVIVEALTRAGARAARQGLTLSTVLTDDSGAARHAEILAKYGVGALTGSCTAPDRPPVSLRYGLWHISVDVAWPWSAARGWFRGATLERALRPSAPRRVGHVRIDVETLARAGRSALSRLPRDLELLAGLASQRGFHAVTLGGAAGRLSCPRPRVAPARSILRAA